MTTHSAESIHGTRTLRRTHAAVPSRMTMARSRGAIVGPLLMLLGAWGALVPFFGHSFGYGYTPSNTWSWTAARGWMEVAPGAGAFLGGVIITGSAHRAAVTFGTWLAVLSGAWFVLGTVFSPWWNAGFLGTPVGSDTHVVLERLGMFSGLGVVIVAIAAMAFGRFTIVGIRDAEASRRRLDAYQKIEESPPVSADPEQFADRPTSDAR